MKALSLVIALAACKGSPTPDRAVANRSPSPTDDLRKLLDQAVAESDHTLAPEVFEVRTKVQAVVENDPRAWWESLTPLQSYWLFELSPAVAARAPVEIRARALCAGVEHVGNGEWWSVPGDAQNENTRRLVRSGLPVSACLSALFDNATPLSFVDGGTSLAAKEHRWTIGDLAAGMIAMLQHEAYEANEPPEARAKQRAELRDKIK